MEEYNAAIRLVIDLMTNTHGWSIVVVDDTARHDTELCYCANDVHFTIRGFFGEFGEPYYQICGQGFTLNCSNVLEPWYCRLMEALVSDNGGEVLPDEKAMRSIQEQANIFLNTSHNIA